MVKRFSYGRSTESESLNAGVDIGVADGVRTNDLMDSDVGTLISTSQMDDGILAAMDASL